MLWHRPSQALAYNRHSTFSNLSETVLSSLLPIFPLNLVLLPSAPLSLHVFEPRYKEMISECLDAKKPFGIVRAKENEGIAEIGCTAEIVSVTKKYPDGRMDILTEGREPFEVMELNQDREFLQAAVLFLQDDPGRATADEISHAVEMHQEILSLAGENRDAAPPDKPQLSFHLAGTLPLDLDFKQSLLTMRSEAERMQAVIQFFETVLPNLRRTVQVRQRAGGNGHVH